MWFIWQCSVCDFLFHRDYNVSELWRVLDRSVTSVNTAQLLHLIKVSTVLVQL